MNQVFMKCLTKSKLGCYKVKSKTHSLASRILQSTKAANSMVIKIHSSDRIEACKHMVTID